jgi:hypothetical protein
MNGRQTASFSKWHEMPTWLRVIVVIALVNFTAYWIIAVVCGGDAWNGYEKADRYYLGSHGAYTEVSRKFWTFSYYHAIAVWLTHGAVFIGAAIYLNSRRKKRSAEPGAVPNGGPATRLGNSKVTEGPPSKG